MQGSWGIGSDGKGPSFPGGRGWSWGILRGRRGHGPNPKVSRAGALWLHGPGPRDEAARELSEADSL